MSLTELIKERAWELGFDLIGIAPAGRAPHADAYVAWVEAGFAAAMGYLQRDMARRQDTRLVLPDAQAVVVVGLSYYSDTPPAELWDDPARGRIARYAWGPDYHEVMLPRLRQLGDFIRQLAGREVQQRAYVDTGPLLERDLAAQAGLGFIGKNTCLISPAWGSYLFLGELLVDLDLEIDAPVTPDRSASVQDVTRRGGCGRCTRCLSACPTGALVAPYLLDSNRCISYLTIENKDVIPEPLRPRLGNWIFGCDECQTVCPWPRRFARPTRQPFLRFDPERSVPRLLDLVALDEAGFKARFGGTPVLRARRRGLLRNVVVALANWGHPAAFSALQRASQDADPLVRAQAASALAGL